MTEPEIAVFSRIEAAIRREILGIDGSDVALLLRAVAVALRSPDEAADAIERIAAALEGQAA